MVGIIRSGARVLLGVMAGGAVSAFVCLQLPGTAFAQERPVGCSDPVDVRKLTGKTMPNWQSPAAVTNAMSSLDLVRKELDASSGASSALAAQVVNSAKQACEGELRVPKTGTLNGPVRMCIGDAASLLARLSPSEETYNQAVCSYSAAIDLASVPASDAGNAARQANAWDKMAQTYSKWPGHFIPAFRAYEQAVAIQKPAPAPRVLGLARAEVAVAKADRSQTRFKSADDHYSVINAPGGSDGLSAADVLAALREQAILRRDDMQSPASARPLFERIAASSDMSPAARSDAYFELGKAQFEGGETGAAANFRLAISPPPRNVPIDSPNAGQANYYLALLGARDANSTDAWKQVFKDARAAGPGELRYRVLACLAHIAAGEKSSLADPTDPNFCPDGPSATEKLQRGLYLLRRAQFHAMFLPCSDKLTATDCNNRKVAAVGRDLDEAKTVFDAGVRLALQEDSPAGKGQATFNWLALREPGTSPSLFGLLSSGKDITAGFREARCKDADPQDKLEREFFRRLDLLKCAATQYTN